jgi:hypothetical protein
MDRAEIGHRFKLFGPILVLGIAQAACGLAYAEMQAEIPAGVSRLLALGMTLLIVYWIVADARRRRCVPCFDFGFLLAISLPLSLVWYAFWTRGWRGFLLLLTLLGLIYGPWVLAVIAWAVFHAVA